MEGIKDFFELIISNFNYLYPGFITIWVFYFIRGKNLKESSNTIIKSIVISYLYINSLPIINSVYLSLLTKFKINNFINTSAEISLLILAIAIPYIICILISCSITKSILLLLGIKTTIYPNPLDELKHKVKKKNYLSNILKLLFRILKVVIYWIHFDNFSKKIWNLIKIPIKRHIDIKDNEAIALCVYLDNCGILYYGWLRLHESDKEAEKTISLSGYKRYRLNTDKEYVMDMDCSKDNKSWVILNQNDITRIEVLLKKAV